MILITGANGYVGTHLTQRLCAEGEYVRALVRRGCGEDEKRLLSCLGAGVTEADIEESEEIARALRDADAVVHLLGSIERPGRGGYEEMHVRKTRLLIDAYVRARAWRSPEGRGRIVYLSAIGASPHARNLYSATKGGAEEEIIKSGFDYLILRSSLIFGRETGSRDSKLIKKLAGLADSRGVIPLVGGGRNSLQPIYIGDCVSVIRAAVKARGSVHDIWEIGGPEIVTLRDIAGLLLRLRSAGRRIVDIPYPVAYFFAMAAKAAGREKLINLEQVRLTRLDSVCSRNMAAEIIGDGLTRLENGLRKSFDRFEAPTAPGGDRA